LWGFLFSSFPLLLPVFRLFVFFEVFAPARPQTVPYSHTKVGCKSWSHVTVFVAKIQAKLDLWGTTLQLKNRNHKNGNFFFFEFL
jgi:hypothetical protein